MKARGYSPTATSGKVFAIIVDPVDEDTITQKTLLSAKTENDESRALGRDDCKMKAAVIDIDPVELTVFNCYLTPGKHYVLAVLVSDSGATLPGYGTMTTSDTHLRFTVPFLSNGIKEAIRVASMSPLAILFTPLAPGRVCIGIRPPGSVLPENLEQAQTMLIGSDACFLRCPFDVSGSQVSVTFSCSAPLGTSQLLVYLNGEGPQPGLAVPFPLYVPVEIPEKTVDFDELPRWISSAPGTLNGIIRFAPKKSGILSAWVSTHPRTAIAGEGQFAVSDCRVLRKEVDARPVEIEWKCPTPPVSPLYIILLLDGVFLELSTIYVPWPTPGRPDTYRIIDRLLAPQLEVSYQVRALNVFGRGLESVVAKKLVATPPDQPFPPQVLNGTAYGFTLFWFPPASALPILEYRLKQRDAGLVYSGSLTSTAVRTRAAYAVAAVNIRGTSPWSVWKET